MVLSLFCKAHIKGKPSLFLEPCCNVPVPSFRKIMVLSFSLPAMRGSRPSKLPSSPEPNPAFSYFQGVAVNRSTSFPEYPLSEQPVASNTAIRENMVDLEIIFTGTVGLRESLQF